METQDIVALILVYLIIVAALGLSLYVQKKGINWDNRKIVHIGVGFFIYVWWAFTANWIMLAFFAVPFAIVLFFAMFPGNPISNSKLGELTNDMGHRYGLFLYVITICLLVAFFFNHWVAATIAIIALTRGDGFGSIVGKKYGKHKIMHGKSLEGSLAVFAATAIISVLVIVLYGYFATDGIFGVYYNVAAHGPVPGIIAGIGYALLAGALAAIIEALCDGEYDNILSPMTIAIVLVLLGL